jgi:tetratricopeptide (TPR) repeat protein
MRGEHEPGDTVGRYRVVRTLGRGGMGVTYEAESLSTGARVALKELRLSRVEDWKSVELFEREARVLASVRHPAVPAYIDHFSLEQPSGPVFYLVQQLAPGRSLEELVASGWRADEAEARRIAEAVLDILDALHGRAPPVYHRDIKPQNVLREEGGKIWLVDFGAVRDVYRSTTVGGSTVAGTFGYMAPEQLHGVARPESDLYGLGATLIFVLSGQTLGQMPQRKLKADFRSRVRVSAHFRVWLEKMLEPAPEDRFLAAVAALKALRDPKIGMGSRSAGGSRTRSLAATLAAVLLGGGAFVAVTELRDRNARVAFAGGASDRTPSDAWLPPRPRDPSLPIGAAPVFIAVAHTPTSSGVFTPDGSRLLTGSLDGAVKIWDARTGKAVGALAGHTGAVRSVQVSRDGHYAVTSGDTTLRIWSLPDGQPVRVIAASSTPLAAAAISPNGALVASSSPKDGVKIWKADGTLVATLNHPGVLEVAFAAGGAWLVTAGQDSTIRVWTVADGSLRATLHGHGAPIGRLAVAPDGLTLASGSDDHTVKLWALQGGELIRTLLVHTDEVWSLAFSPDGGTLLSGDKAGVLARWEVPIGRLIGTMSMDPRLLGTMSLAFAPSGLAFATMQENGNAVLWTLVGAGAHSKFPRGNIVQASAPSGPTEAARTYARALDLVDAYHGHDDSLSAAETLFKRMLLADSRSAMALAGLARVGFKRSLITRDTFDEPGLERALGLAERAIANDPTFADGFVAKGWILRGLKDTVGARGVVDQARRLDPTSARVLALDATLASDDGETARAEQLFSDALSRPMTASLAGTVYAYLREVYWDTGDMDAVDACDRRSIELTPESAWAKGNYAFFLLEKGDFEAAIAMAQSALSQMDYGVARTTLAEAYCAKGHLSLWDGHDPETARKAFDNAVRAQESNACGHYGLGAYYQYLGKKGADPHALQEARRDYQSAADLDPKDGLASAALANLP